MEVSDEISGRVIDLLLGLTMLMAHLLNQSRAFRRHKLRVMTITDYSTDESVKLKRTEIRMIHLLTKFRIRAQTTGKRLVYLVLYG